MPFVFDSRTPLSVHERETLAGNLTNLKSERTKHAAEIHQLETTVETLKSALSSLDEQISQQEAALSPIQTLPNELISEILWYSIDNMMLTPSRWISKPGVPPSVLLLSTVCRRWRDIAVSSPSLWSEFRINYWERAVETDKLIIRAEKLLEGVHQFLNRSKSRPLTFTLWWKQRRTRDTEEDERFRMKGEGVFPRLLSTLVDASGRWYDVDLSFNGNGFGPQVFQSFGRLGGNMRQLKRLELQCLGSPLPPVLRDVFAHPDTPILDHIRIIDGTPADAVYFVAKARKFEAEELVYGQYRGPVVEGRETTDAIISAVAPWTLNEVLRNYNLPNLKSLELGRYLEVDHPWDEFWDISALVNFFQISGFGSSTHGLRKLHLSFIPFLDTEVVRMLEMIPTLEHLVIEESLDLTLDEDDNEHFQPSVMGNFIVTTGFSKRFTRTSDTVHGPGFLPRLQRLDLGVAWEGLDQQALVDAVASRRPGSILAPNQKPLCDVKVNLKSGNKTDFEILFTMEHLSGDGLTVFIQYPPECPTRNVVSSGVTSS